MSSPCPACSTRFGSNQDVTYLYIFAVTVIAIVVSIVTITITTTIIIFFIAIIIVVVTVIVTFAVVFTIFTLLCCIWCFILINVVTNLPQHYIFIFFIQFVILNIIYLSSILVKDGSSAATGYQGDDDDDSDDDDLDDEADDPCLHEEDNYRVTAVTAQIEESSDDGYGYGPYWKSSCAMQYLDHVSDWLVTEQRVFMYLYDNYMFLLKKAYIGDKSFLFIASADILSCFIWIYI